MVNVDEDIECYCNQWESRLTKGARNFARDVWELFDLSNQGEDIGGDDDYRWSSIIHHYYPEDVCDIDYVDGNHWMMMLMIRRSKACCYSMRKSICWNKKKEKTGLWEREGQLWRTEKSHIWQTHLIKCRRFRFFRYYNEMRCPFLWQWIWKRSCWGRRKR